MRKAVAIFLLIFLIVPFIGGYLWLKHEIKVVRREVKKEMLAGMDRKELVLLKFTKEEVQNELHWEHDKEFEYRGEMYDIVEQERDGDSAYFWCWWDHEETRLNRQLSFLVTKALGRDPHNQQNQKRLANFIKTLYFNSFPEFHYASTEDHTIKNTPYLFHYSSVNLSPSPPPPRFA